MHLFHRIHVHAEQLKAGALQSASQKSRQQALGGGGGGVDTILCEAFDM